MIEIAIDFGSINLNILPTKTRLATGFHLQHGVWSLVCDLRERSMCSGRLGTLYYDDDHEKRMYPIAIEYRLGGFGLLFFKWLISATK